jgi:hypothetical protein
MLLHSPSTATGSGGPLNFQKRHSSFGPLTSLNTAARSSASSADLAALQQLRAEASSSRSVGSQK